MTVTTATAAALAASPDRVNPHHLREWVAGSAVAPELAAANLESLQGTEVLEALLGDRLAALGGHASQYVTAPAARLLRPLEPVAEGGGWWCSGLDPLADWAPMRWGCFKPERPRWETRNGKQRQRKYEHPLGTPARAFWLRVPTTTAERVAGRFGLALPTEVAADHDGSAGAFWRWWWQEPRLPLLLTEGSKKAGALLSLGIPAVALAGVWNGCPKGANGRPELLPELAAAPWAGREAAVLFDYTPSDQGHRDVVAAADRLGRLLVKAGATARVGCCPGPHKGLDDALVAGVPWEVLEAELHPIGPVAALPAWPAPTVVAPAGQWLAQACPIPAAEVAPLVALHAPMGAGKTESLVQHLAPLMAAGTRVLLVTHRRSLGAALAERLGLPWAEEASPGSDLRQQGLACCLDSLCPGSALRIRPADWHDCIVVIDEAAAVLQHGLSGTATAIAGRRPEVLQTLSGLLAGAAQTIAADAQLTADVVAALEDATGRQAHVISSQNRPAEGRTLVNHAARAGWQAELVAQLQARNRLWIATSARTGPNGAATLAALVQEHWPEARVLVVDSDTVSDPSHDAAALAADPNTVAGRFDVVLASPAVAAGLSVDRLPGHFAAVFAISGATTDPDAVVQALARVRDGVPRHLHVPERSPGGALQTGTGSFAADALLRHLGDHAQHALQLLTAGGFTVATNNNAGPWLRLWAQQSALRNRQRLSYRATVIALLEKEGYTIVEAEPLSQERVQVAAAAAVTLERAATEATAAQDAAVIAAEPLTAAEAAELAKRRRLSPHDRALLQRHRIAVAWGLGDTAPSQSVIEADREGLHQRRRFAWVLTDMEGRQLAARHDRAVAASLGQGGGHWAPDLARQTLGSKLAAADALGVPAWLAREDWFTADDPRLLALQAQVTAHGAPIQQVLGISPGTNATTTLRRLLQLAGYRLEPKRMRIGGGQRAWHYRVVPEDLPVGITVEQLQQAWRSELAGWPKKSPTPIGAAAGRGFGACPPPAGCPPCPRP